MWRMYRVDFRVVVKISYHSTILNRRETKAFEPRVTWFITSHNVFFVI